LLRFTLHNLSTAVPQALGEMLDSVQTDSTQAEGEDPSSAPAVPTPPAQPATPPLVKKEILNAALAYLESEDEGQPQEIPAQSVPIAPPAEALILPQKTNPEPLPVVPDSPAENADPRDSRPEVPVLTPQKPIAKLRNKTPETSIPLPEVVAEERIKTSLPVTGRLFESPARLMAALVADEEREIMSARFQYADSKPRPPTESTRHFSAMTEQTSEEKPGTSLLSLTHRLLKWVSDDRHLPANLPTEQRHQAAEADGNVQGEAFWWPKRDKQQGRELSAEQADDRSIADKNDERNGPTWHPFPPAVAESPEQASAGLLAAVLVSLFATLLVIVLLVLNL